MSTMKDVKRKSGKTADTSKRSKPRFIKDEGTSQHSKSLLYGTAIIPAVAVIILAMKFYQPQEGGNYAVLASADSTTEKQFYEVPCSKDYGSEPFTECKPKFCGRVVMDSLVTQEEADRLLRVAKAGIALGGSSGGASILDLHSGALSKGDRFINVYSLPGDDSILTEDDFSTYRSVKNKIKMAISDHFQIPPSKLYLTKPTFFSRFNMSEPRTIHDEYWHSHIDKETYGSFHYTSLLYLTTYKKDFDGGRFIFVDKDTNSTVEPRTGRVSFFTSGSENVHFVERLKDGVRYAITISFTCDPEKAIPEPAIKLK